MKKIFFLPLTVFIMLWVLFAYTEEKVNPQVLKIDKQIEELEDMKRGYEARALRHENQAERLQFDDKAVLETRRHIQIAEENRQKANFLQQEIDALKAQREKLIKERG